jgi:AAA+ superfamily predicted ATPase
MLHRDTETHMHAVCRWVDALLQRQIERVRDQRGDEPPEFRGLVLTEAQVERLMTPEPTSANPIDDCDEAIRVELPQSSLHQLAERFALSRAELRIVMLALAPELDLRYQALFGYVQNDITRRLPTVDLILKTLFRTREEQWSEYALFSPGSTLLRNDLLQFGTEHHGHDPSLLSRSVMVSPRIVRFLFGDLTLDESLLNTAALLPACCSFTDFASGSEHAEQLWRLVPRLRSGGTVVLRGPDGAGKLSVAQSICNELQQPMLVVDDAALEVAGKRALGVLLRRECTLLHAALYLKLRQPKAEDQQGHRALTTALADVPFPIFQSIEDQRVAALEIPGQHCFRFELPVPDIEVRRNLWLSELAEYDTTPLPAAEVEELAGEFQFTPGLIRKVVHNALSISMLRRDDNGGVTATDIRQAAHSNCNIRLRGLAGRVELRFGWDDLVLPQRVLQQLQEVEAGVRLRHQVHARWGFGSKLGNQTGASVLFSGVSGTGKTMAASVLARSLGLELYKIDLSCVVSKYIGETEQNLARIFDEAERSSAVLFFDEADALFGKRSEVKDAHDRYANIEVAYLLQRMEQFSGLAVLATNLSRNMDDAFVRRLQHVVEFPFPDVVHRERIWRTMFPEAAPQSDDLDFEFLARQFEFSGGNIRNVVAAAAFLAADAGQAIGMEHLVQAIGREMQKMGKLPSKATFQGHLEVITRQNNGRN